ncbi:MAG TPA: acyltransferase [Solirubrobacteraceae bacterium]|jgi:peptidoglycan/LPS O-acetylase OafA/YrhL|nr:acyltransferase [Solirubrobacteraceae bacterium]
MRGKRLERLDDLRGVAALLVVTCHATELWDATRRRQTPHDLAYLGSFGVAIFFVISGLVIYRPFVSARATGGRSDLWGYAVRRLTRIVPPYWVALAFFAVVLPAAVSPVGSTGISTFWAFGQIYTHGTYFQGLGVAWSLGVEMSFYIAAPLIAFALRRRDSLEPYVLVGLWLLSFLVRVASPDGVIGGTIVGYFGWFAVGMWLARASCSTTTAKPRLGPAWTWTLAGAGYLLLCEQVPTAWPNQGTLLSYVGLGLLGGLVVLPAITNPGRPGLKWLGDRSYGVYLWHFPIFQWLAEQRLALGLYAAVGLVLTLGAAHFSHRYLEQPLMRRASALAKLRRGPVSVAPPVRTSSEVA